MGRRWWFFGVLGANLRASMTHDESRMIFIETRVFTEDVQTLLSVEEYRCFQLLLACVPEIGDVIQGTGGLRKVRWASGGKGKRSACGLFTTT